MNHKERCRQLKEIRKQIADKIGIDLHQSECTFEGECKGTCPKCAKEEKTLNKALLTGTVALSAVALTACGSSLGENYESREDKLERIEKTQSKCDKNVSYDYDDDVVGEIEDVELAGDVEYIGEGEPGVSIDDGNVDEYVLDGDVVDTSSDFNYNYNLDSAQLGCENYSKAPIVEFDHYDNDDEQYPVFHCYELVDDGDGSLHTATIDWITVDLSTLMATTFDESIVDLTDYL